MSKTDKTRPLWVRALDAPRNLTEQHDHTNGICELQNTPVNPARRKPQEPTPLPQNGECYWDYSNQFLYSKAARCGCPLCTAAHQRRVQRRRSRHQFRQAARSLTREQLDDIASSKERRRW